MSPSRNGRYLSVLSVLVLACTLQQRGSSTEVSLAHEAIRVNIDRHVARTAVEMTFRNSTNREREHEFLFPLPLDAVVSDFRLTMNGEAIPGEILDERRARPDVAIRPDREYRDGSAAVLRREETAAGLVDDEMRPAAIVNGLRA